jgi:hypothetical protein
MAYSLYANDYKKLDDFSAVLLSLIQDYVHTNSAQSSSDIVDYINSSATSTVFSDAKNSGYTRFQLLFQTYQLSFVSNATDGNIIQALHDVLIKDSVLNDTVYYGSLSTIGIMIPMITLIIRHAYLYFRFDRPTLNFYRSHDQTYIRSTRGASGYEPLDTSEPQNSIATNPQLLIPEPFIPNPQ